MTVKTMWKIRTRQPEMVQGSQPTDERFGLSTSILLLRTSWKSLLHHHTQDKLTKIYSLSVGVCKGVINYQTFRIRTLLQVKPLSISSVLNLTSTKGKLSSEGNTGTSMVILLYFCDVILEVLKNTLNHLSP